MGDLFEMLSFFLCHTWSHLDTPITSGHSISWPWLNGDVKTKSHNKNKDLSIYRPASAGKKCFRMVRKCEFKDMEKIGAKIGFNGLFLTNSISNKGNLNVII